MSGLHPDESHCTSEIGKLIFQPKSTWTATIKVADIVPSKGLAGTTHNNYILQFKLVPQQIIEIESRTFYLTTRFRELDKLYKGLQKTHKQLYLRGTFPGFAPTKLIGAGEPAVLEERRQATETFLNFVLDNEVLRKSLFLHQFLDKATEKVNTAAIAEDEVYSTIESALPSATFPGSPIEEHLSSDVTALSGDIDFHFPEIALGQPPLNISSKVNLRRPFPRLQMDLEAARPNTSDYLVRAGFLISTAQKAEAENEFELAFQCYKNAAKNLSEGLRTETDTALRNSVKLKTAKYIVRAEQLFKTYLNYDGSAFNLEGLLADSLHLHDPTIFAFKSSNSALKDYTVIGVLPSVRAQNKVLLMEEKLTGSRYVLKFLEKGIERSDSKIVLPTAVPHMVQLYKFFETEDHILLLLEYASNGRLFDFLNRSEQEHNKLKRSRTAPIHSKGILKRPRRYSYMGQRLLFSVGFDIERVAAMRDEQQSTADPSNCEMACAMGEDCAAEVSGDAGEFFISQSTVEGADEVQEEMPAEVKFRSKPARKQTYGSSESLASCLKEVRELILSRRTWPQSLSLPEPLIVHWTAQIVSFLYMLHTVYDEYVGAILASNLLLDSNGNLLLTYHGRWFTQNLGRSRGWHYSAPESRAVEWSPCAIGDVYSFGCILFELTTGTTHYEAAPHGITRDSEETLNPNGLISFACWDLLIRTLSPENERCSLEDIRSHPYFSAIDWSLYDNPHACTLPNKVEIPTITEHSLFQSRVNNVALTTPPLAQRELVSSELETLLPTNLLDSELTASTSKSPISLNS